MKPHYNTNDGYKNILQAGTNHIKGETSNIIELKCGMNHTIVWYSIAHRTHHRNRQLQTAAVALCVIVVHTMSQCITVSMLKIAA